MATWPSKKETIQKGMIGYDAINDESNYSSDISVNGNNVAIASWPFCDDEYSQHTIKEITHYMMSLYPGNMHK